MLQNISGLVDAKVALEFNKFWFPRPDLYQDESMTKKFTTDPEHSAVDKCCGSGMFIPDPRSEFFPPRIRITEFTYFNPKKWFLSSEKYDLGCSSRIRMPDHDPNFYPFRMAPDPDPQHFFQQRYHDMCVTVPVPTLSNRFMRAAAVPWHTLRYPPCPTDTWRPQRYHDIRKVTHLVQQKHEGRDGTMTYVTTVPTLPDRYMRAATVPWHTLRYSPCPTICSGEAASDKQGPSLKS